MDPPPISLPLSTMSYAFARTAPGSVSSRAMSSGLGLVKGWCMANQRLESSSHSSRGKSTTQSGANSKGLRSPSSWPRCRRSSLRALRVLPAAPASTSTRSPGSAPKASAQFFSADSSKNLFTEELGRPCSSRRIQIRPVMPSWGRLTKSVRASSCLRL